MVLQRIIELLELVGRLLAIGHIQDNPLNVRGNAAFVGNDEIPFLHPADLPGLREHAVLQGELAGPRLEIWTHFGDNSREVVGMDDGNPQDAAGGEVGRRVAELVDVVRYEIDRPIAAHSPPTNDGGTAIDDRVEVAEVSQHPLERCLGLLAFEDLLVQGRVGRHKFRGAARSPAAPAAH